ncbi:ubiquinol-cytochrome c reductase iron-sulfur subunit [Lipingzhangella halophila]|uniref:Cytochrome bc1 complex Rieske iron-sulfur subunit n=1 Tax=Lipingzhangella halophila TaxID=1783352 RepID=A0A7W7RF67_9ACTN|nr:Rieske 2Fe-2S domain-containing protein [Lipingzhangella halophila]MBB4930820.1 ubiquinol-cytochrome c reductase iron-sulfur subunit [Lipingzhangella halophila]
MTDNTSNHHNNEAGAGDRDRVIGTPSPSGSDAIVAGTTEQQRGHDGPYPAEETHGHSEEEQRRGEKVAAVWFTIAFLTGMGFVVAFFLFPPDSISDPRMGQYSTMALGGTLGLALFAIGAGMTVWARRVMPHYEVSSPYDELPSAPEEKGSFGQFFMKGADESGFTRRPLMRRTLLLAMAPLGIAPIVLLRDTGPLPGDKLKHTMWEKGMHMVAEGTHRRLTAADLETDGSMISALPYSEPTAEHPHGLSLNEQAKTSIILIKMPAEDWKPGMTEQQRNWTHDNIVAYSKICTHVGCPAALYEQTTHRILCPCHQSTFDAANGAEVVFGPAHRPLPQLPITVDNEGYLVADGDFSSPVGPTFWDAEKGE